MLQIKLDIKKKKKQQYLNMNTDTIEAHYEAEMAEKKKTKSMFELALEGVNLKVEKDVEKTSSKKKNDKDDDRTELLVDIGVPKNTTSVNIYSKIFETKINKSSKNQQEEVDRDEILEEIWGRMKLSSFFIFEKDNILRVWCEQQIQPETAFEWFIIFSILVSSVMIVVNPSGNPSLVQ